MGDSDVEGASMEMFLALMAVLMVLLLVGGLYLLKDRASMRSQHMSRSFLARILLHESEAMTRLDLERKYVLVAASKPSLDDRQNDLCSLFFVLCSLLFVR
ncbi:hypothetical protein PINS_up014617 [Pythium insidiosum]|nr:hypothetical protein PINS_up014617 [Pythium insidiosum]